MLSVLFLMAVIRPRSCFFFYVVYESLYRCVNVVFDAGKFSSNLFSRSYLPTPPLGQDMTQGQFLSGVLQVGIQSFPSPRLVATPTEEPSLPYYLPITGRRIFGFIRFPRVLVLCEMQSVLSKNWTRIAVSISCDDNHYTTGTSFLGTYSLWDVMTCAWSLVYKSFGPFP